MTADLHYEDRALAELYDLTCGWSIDRDFYLNLPGTEPKRILDLGCGTGLLCDAWAEQGHRVTGVDPAAAMLEIARRKPYGKAVEWVQSTAQDFRSEQRFDFIIMTGHAFQVLLEDDDIHAGLSTMRDHLAPGGVIAFESRNAQLDWFDIWRKRSRQTIAGTDITWSLHDVEAESNRITFEQHFTFADSTLISKSELLFLSRAEIEKRLTAAALEAKAVYGDWNFGPFDESISQEMIFIAGPV